MAVKEFLIIKCFITSGPNHVKIIKKPLVSKFLFDHSNKLNLQLTKQILEQNKIDPKEIDDYRFYDTKKNGFIKIKENSEILINENTITLQINFKENIEKKIAYYKDILNSIKQKITKLQIDKNTSFDKKLQKYDIVDLYACPLVKVLYNGELKEFEEQINYRREIESIVKICNESKKELNCRFECCDINKLLEYLQKSPTKILHISCHGKYNLENNEYFLTLENEGKEVKINKDDIDKNLSKNENMDNIDLIFISACQSEPIGKLLFSKNYAKNVICIDSRTEVDDEAAIKFCEMFYRALIIDSLSIKEAFQKTKEKFPDISINQKLKGGFYEKHSHDEKCLLKKAMGEGLIINKDCLCNFQEWNIHLKDCVFLKKWQEFKEKQEKNKEINPFLQNEEKLENGEIVYKICCCNGGIRNENMKITVPHNESKKFILLSNNIENGENNNIFKKKSGKLNIDNQCFLDCKKDKIKNLNKEYSVIGRRVEMQKIYKIINKDEKNDNIILIWGISQSGKIEFVESLCIYLYEQGVIKDFKYYITFDDIFEEETLEQNIKNFKNEKKCDNNIRNKYLVVIRIPPGLEKEITIKLVEIILKNKEITHNNDNFYYIIIFTENNLDPKFEKKQNIKLTELDSKLSENYLKKLLRKFNFKFSFENIKDFEKKIPNKGLYPKILENVADFIEEKNLTNLKNFDFYFKEENEKQNIRYSSEQEDLNKIYFLLKTMPKGLLSEQLLLIIPNFKEIIKKEIQLISFPNYCDHFYKINSYSYSNYIIEMTDENIKKFCIERCLEMYAKILYYYIKNYYRFEQSLNGNIKYNFNSLNANGYWKSLNENLFNFCFRIDPNEKNLYRIISKNFFDYRNYHEENIRKLISNNFFYIKTIINENEINGYNIYKEFLDQIMIMLPSVFIDDEEKCKYLINRSIKLCKELNEINFNKEIKRLQLFLNSINSKKKDEINTDIDEELTGKEGKAEAYFLNGLNTKNIDSFNSAIKFYNYTIEDFKKRNSENINKISCKNYINYLNKRLSYVFYELGLLIKNKKNFTIAISNFTSSKTISEQNKDDFLTIKCNIELADIEKKWKNYNNLNRLLNSSITIGKKYNYYLNNLKISINKKIEPNIMILNSNPLKKLQNNQYITVPAYHNNQCYLLNELKNIKFKCRLKIQSNILNKENFNEVINQEAKILIIQSDDFTDISIENNSGLSQEILTITEMKEILPVVIKYDLVILGFYNSKKMIPIFKNKKLKYLITFDNISNLDKTGDNLIKYNKYLVDFLIDLIRNLNEFDVDTAFINSKIFFLNKIKNINKFIDENNSEIIKITEDENTLTPTSFIQNIFIKNYDINKLYKSKFTPKVNIPNSIYPNYFTFRYTDTIYQIIYILIYKKSIKMINIYNDNIQSSNFNEISQINYKIHLILNEVFRFFNRHHEHFIGGVKYIANPKKKELFRPKKIPERKLQEMEKNIKQHLIIINNFDKIKKINNEFGIKFFENNRYLIVSKSKIDTQNFIHNIQVNLEIK